MWLNFGKTRGLVGFCLLLGILLLTAGAVVWQPRKTDCKKPVSDNNKQFCYKKSVSRGLSYLNNNAGQVSPLQWLIVEYLDRKFNLGPTYSFANRHVVVPTEEIDAEDFKIFKRIAEPDQLIDKLPYDKAAPIRKMMMAAAHCDHIPLPLGYDQLLEQNLELGGYNMTHVSFSLERMHENRCSLSEGQDKELRESVATKMAELSRKSDINDELRYEAVAFLINMGRRELVTSDVVDKIVAEQQADGGWKISSDKPSSSDHATVLAVWALLEYSQPGAPKVPVIRRPSLR